MYEAFFRFQSRPFPASPMVANYFPAQSMESARQNLIRALERTEGPGLIIGPAGVGKTLLLHMLANHFSQALRVIMLSGTRVTTRKSLLQTLLFELDLPYRGMDEGELRLSLIDALRRNESIRQGVLLLIDEAQTLSLRLLDEIRLITNVAQDGQPRVRLVLSGSPRLEERFTNPKLESFNQRIATRCYLQAFTRDETNEFVRAQLSWAGGNPNALISDETVRAVFQATDGIPRLINQICDHALVLAHASGQVHINAFQIQDAWADLQQLPPPWQSKQTTETGVQRTVIEFGELAEDLAEPFRETPVANVKANNQITLQFDDDDTDLLLPSLAELEVDTRNDHTPGVEIDGDNLEAVAFEDLDLEGVKLDGSVSASADSVIGQNDCPGEEEPEEEFIEPIDLEALCEAMTIGPPNSDGSLEWVTCGEVADGSDVLIIEDTLMMEDTGRHVEADPFADSAFEEDVVVIDRFAARNLDGLRDRPRVTCAESRALAASLSLIEFGEQPEEVRILCHDSCLAADTPTGQLFEFSTVQDLPEIDLLAEFSEEVSVTVPGSGEHVELDFEDEIDCVPLPWTHDSLGDDRDIIIVEEDSPRIGLGSELETVTDGVRRTEFRDLFAQLRRVST